MGDKLAVVEIDGASVEVEYWAELEAKYGDGFAAYLNAEALWKLGRYDDARAEVIPYAVGTPRANWQGEPIDQAGNWASWWVACHRDAGRPIVFRLDDYSAVSDAPRLALEQDLFAAHKQYGVPLTVGVIPEKTGVLLGDDAERLALLLEAVSCGVWEPAMHGYRHVSVRQETPWTEFEGVTFGGQRTLVANGSAYMTAWCDRPCKVFIPPFNTYDANTLVALHEKGFKILSGAEYGGPASVSPIKTVHANCDLLSLPTLLDAGPTSDVTPIVVIFHHYDISDYDAVNGQTSLAQYEALLARVWNTSWLRPAMMLDLA